MILSMIATEVENDIEYVEEVLELIQAFDPRCGRAESQGVFTDPSAK